MEKICPICDYPLNNGDKVVACVLSTYVEIPSTSTFAIEHPEKCIEIVHSGCYDWEDQDDAVGGMELQ